MNNWIPPAQPGQSVQSMQMQQQMHQVQQVQHGSSPQQLHPLLDGGKKSKNRGGSGNKNKVATGSNIGQNVLLVISLLFFIFALILTVSNMDSNPAEGETVFCEVTFISTVTGHASFEMVVRTSQDKLLVKPVNPTLDGFSFKGWFKDATFAEAWIFETDLVEGDVTLFAKWESAVPGPTEPTEPTEPIEP